MKKNATMKSLKAKLAIRMFTFCFRKSVKSDNEMAIPLVNTANKVHVVNVMAITTRSFHGVTKSSNFTRYVSLADMLTGSQYDQPEERLKGRNSNERNDFSVLFLDSNSRIFGSFVAVAAEKVSENGDTLAVVSVSGVNK